MKLRIEDDTLRLRLSQGELDEFAANRPCRRSGAFWPQPRPAPDLRAGTRFGTCPNIARRAEPVQVHYEPGALTVLVPFALARTWVETDQNGFLTQRCHWPETTISVFWLRRTWTADTDFSYEFKS